MAYIVKPQDDDWSVARDYGARTISLHNMCYELRWDGRQLWIKEEDRAPWVIGSVFLKGVRRWQAWCDGLLLGAFETEELAREVVEAAVKVGGKGAR